MVQWPEFLAIDPEISILGSTIFFLEVVGLERGPLSLVSTIDWLLEKKKVAAPV
jgi:hypothetical protein